MEGGQTDGQLNRWMSDWKEESPPPPPKDSEGRSTCGDPHLEGAQAQLQGQANAEAGTIRQEVEDDVVNSKQRDEEKGGLGEPPTGEDKP